MNIKLNEWNELVKYGEHLCDVLKEKGYDVRLKPYAVYDGRKGLSMQVFDGHGNYFTTYYSGINNYEIMRTNLYGNMIRVLKEC